ncbi:MAG: septum formation initiator family protein [Marinicaulis sp.]|nr:septum formation initiator family protein [Marinicaulis sp.]
MLRSKFIFNVLAPSFLLTWATALVYSAVFSDTGYRALSNLEAEVETLSEEVTVLHERRVAMQKRSVLLSSKSLDPDLIDERIRSVLGYSREGDISISRRELDRALKNLAKSAD